MGSSHAQEKKKSGVTYGIIFFEEHPGNMQRTVCCGCGERSPPFEETVYCVAVGVLLPL
jgi:hypothetical protein